MASSSVPSLSNGARARFSYSDNYQGLPVSLSLPREEPTNNARPYLEGLLPDNWSVRVQWGRDFHVNPRNPFKLLAHTGNDAPGAIQLVPTGTTLDMGPGAAMPLNEVSLSTLIHQVAGDEGYWSPPLAGPHGRFSLAGAQRKTALYQIGAGQWALPYGRFPSTHIIKPEIGRAFPLSDVNEAVCLRAMNALGISAAQVTVTEFGQVRASVIERYDRIRTSQGVDRVHQEDMCQILAVMPEKKYAVDGGPGVTAILDILTSHATPECPYRFIEQLTFNVAILGTDAHAKNFSVLHYRDGRTELAPAYDVASWAPYDAPLGQSRGGARLAMPIGGSNKFHEINERRWVKVAQIAGLHEDRVIELTRRVLHHSPDALADAIRAFSQYTTGTALEQIPLAAEKQRQLTCGHHRTTIMGSFAPRNEVPHQQNDGAPHREGPPPGNKSRRGSSR